MADRYQILTAKLNTKQLRYIIPCISNNIIHYVIYMAGKLLSSTRANEYIPIFSIQFDYSTAQYTTLQYIIHYRLQYNTVQLT